jgi:Trypsin-co-occurring domain 1
VRQQEPDIVEVQLPDGDIILAEVRTPSGDVSAFDRLTMDNIGRSAAKVAYWAKKTALESMPEPPSSLSVEVGVRLVAKGSRLVAVVADVSAEGAIAVTLQWDLR